MSRYKRATPGNGVLFLKGGDQVDVAEIFKKSSDPTANIVQMTYPHAAVHRDVIINASHYQAAADGDLLFFFTSGLTLQPHLEYIVVAGGVCRVRFYEDPAIFDAGAVVPGRRLHRGTTKVAQALVNVGGSVVAEDYGTLLKDQYNGGGGGGANTRGGSAVHDDAEWVLKLNTSYCLRLTRAASQITGVEFEWYEVPAL